MRSFGGRATTTKVSSFPFPFRSIPIPFLPSIALLHVFSFRPFVHGNRCHLLICAGSISIRGDGESWAFLHIDRPYTGVPSYRPALLLSYSPYLPLNSPSFLPSARPAVSSRPMWTPRAFAPLCLRWQDRSVLLTPGRKRSRYIYIYVCVCVCVCVACVRETYTTHTRIRI